MYDRNCLLVPHGMMPMHLHTRKYLVFSLLLVAKWNGWVAGKKKGEYVPIVAPEGEKRQMSRSSTFGWKSALTLTTYNTHLL